MEDWQEKPLGLFSKHTGEGGLVRLKQNFYTMFGSNLTPLIILNTPFLQRSMVVTVSCCEDAFISWDWESGVVGKMEKTTEEYLMKMNHPEI